MNTCASIMMVTYNRVELTKKTLNSLLETQKIPFYLYLVDNCSTDNSWEYLSKFCMDNSGKDNFKGFQIKKNDTNLGIAIARNQALSMAQEDWLVTLDNDVILPNNAIENAISILKVVPEYGAIGVNFEKQNYPLIKKSSFEFQSKPKGNLGTACMVFNKSLHKMLGYFNTEYGLYGLEDSDFGMRVRVLGLKLGYIKENGEHLGEGNNDIGEYRKFKTKTHDAFLNKFNKNCSDYVSGRKSIYISSRGFD